ncbi:MAG: hypothetical protein GY941_22235 [Planctomycetes bacterium]|nr:hypothetical protein [Planctomycetota bacterium]
MSSVIIDGFESTKDAEEFVKWYSGQGEQDADIWMEEQEEWIETSMYDLVLSVEC